MTARAPADLADWLALIDTLSRLGWLSEALDGTRRAHAALGDCRPLRALREQVEQALAQAANPSVSEEIERSRTARRQAHLAVPLQAAGQPAAAADCLRAALESEPLLHADVDELLAVAAILAEQGSLTLAAIVYRKVLARAPARADVWAALAGVLAMTDAVAEATACLRRALELRPTSADLWFLLANTLADLGILDQAEQAVRRALELQPAAANAWTHLGELLRKTDRCAQALQAHRRALAIAPEHPDAHRNLARLWVDLARFDAAARAFERALAVPGLDRSERALVHGLQLFSMGFGVQWPAPVMRAQAERWERLALSDEERQAARAQQFARPPASGRRLRLGLLSSELGQHSVGFFLLPWLQALDRRQFELFLYATRLRAEPQAARFRRLADVWTPVAGWSDVQIVERIRADRIDVLIDTSGHTKHSRLGVLARRAAPVQCHYIGYFATTGLTEMDYFIADAVLIPPEQDAGFTERVWRLPRSRYAYQPLEEAPAPTWRPDPHGRLWLGSFNQLNKVREDSLALWSALLRALPNARLLLKAAGAADPSIQRRILDALRRHGIAAERVQFVGRASLWGEHMDLYNHIDLALDTVPFTSATTGFEALWMGTPLVTLLGEQPAGRQAASLLTGLGRDEWIARAPEDYLRIALDLLAHPDERRRIRATQRERMRQSELCDGVGLAKVLQQAFRDMFDRWHAVHAQIAKR